MIKWVNEMFNIGDYVTRNSYNNDIVFRIIDIKNDIYIRQSLHFINDTVFIFWTNDVLIMLDDTATNSSAFINSIFILSPIVFYYL